MKQTLACALFLAFSTPAVAQERWLAGAFIDAARLTSSTRPPDHLFRGRGTTPRLDEWNVNMAGVWLKGAPAHTHRFAAEIAVHTGEDAKIFGFSSTAPNARGASVLTHFGPTNASYLAPVGNGLTLQGGIFSSLIGYDSLYAKDNFAYTRPWGADYTPYLMLGASASYPMTPKLTGTIAAVNGYWHLAHANDAPSVAVQAAYKATDRVGFKQAVLLGSHQSRTAPRFWRILSDTIVERKVAALTTAFEYQIAFERVDTPQRPRALWMSAQLPCHWTIHDPWSVTIRPEVAWDRDGRWIAGQLGRGQSVRAITATGEYRTAYKHAAGAVRVEYRYDNSRGPAGGFTTKHGLRPGQHLAIVAFILTLERGAPP